MEQSTSMLECFVQDYFNNLAVNNYADLYFFKRVTYSPSDNWATDNDWRNVAWQAHKHNRNYFWAIEVLLKLDETAVLPIAIRHIDEWQQAGGYDYHYYMDLVAVLPKSHTVRKHFFANDKFERILLDGTSFRAMVYAEDEEFFEFIKKFVDKKLTTKNVEIEEEILPIIMRLENRASHILSEQSKEIIQDFSLAYFNKDKIMANRYFNGEKFSCDERLIWIASEIGYLAWCLQSKPILTAIQNADWYWAGLFSEDYIHDYDHHQLLALSAMMTSPLLQQQADYVINNFRDMKGVIARYRLQQQEATWTL